MDTIRSKAQAILALTGQGNPPVSVTKITNYLEIPVSAIKLPERQPGFTALILNHWYIFINDRTKLEGLRWTIAHELGHILLDHRGDALVFEVGKQQEDAANHFAHELLMPDDMVIKESRNTNLSAGDLADVFVVNTRAMENRLMQLTCGIWPPWDLSADAV